MAAKASLRNGTQATFRRAITAILTLAGAGGLIAQTSTQKWTWPTDASRALSSSFGEYRPGHFHAGVDIKTWGRTGYRVFAAASGYIWKVRVSPFGYGKVVYQVTDSGEIVVYAHLSRFVEPVESLVKKEQRRKLRYSVTLEFRPNQIRVDRGQVIAYTGDTGVGYPHLHFEVRDSRNRPTNPMLHGFRVEDRISPIPAEVAFIPVTWWARVEGDVAPLVLPVVPLSKALYTVRDTVAVWGPFYVAVRASDRTNAAQNRIAPYGLRLYVDGRLVFSSRYDRFSYAQTGLIVLDRDFRLQVRTGRSFFRLFVDPENDLPFYGPFRSGAGVLWGGPRIYPNRPVSSNRWLEELLQATEITLGRHELRIEAFDFDGNTCAVVVPVQVRPPHTHRKHAGALGGGTWPDDGEEETPLKVDWYEDFARLEITSWAAEEPRALVELSTDTAQLATEPIGPGQWIAVWPFPERDILEGELIVSCGGTTVRRPFRLARCGEKNATLALTGLGVRVDIPARAGFWRFFAEVLEDSTAGTQLFPQPSGPVVRLVPEDVPLRSAASLRWVGDSRIAHYGRKLGWYYAGSDGWKFVGNQLSPDGSELLADICGFGCYGVVLDTIPPVLAFRSPSPSQGAIFRGKALVISMYDELSGIGGEDDFGVELDGQKIVVEWDPEEKVLRYQPEDQLSRGEHVLRVWAVDRSGNRSERALRFFVD